MTDEYRPKPGHEVKFDGFQKTSIVLADVNESFIPGTTIINTNGWNGWVSRNKLKYIPRHSNGYSSWESRWTEEYESYVPRHRAGD